MAINVGFEILVASAVSADTKSNILTRVLAAVQDRTVTATYNASYSAGSTSKSLVSIEVGGTSEDYGIRVVMDSAVVGTTTYSLILSRLLQVLQDQTLTLTASATAYTAGDRAHNVILTLT